MVSLFQNLYYICNERALRELKESYGASAAQESSTNGQKGLEETLEKLLTGDFDEDSVYDWVKVSIHLVACDLVASLQ